jgi:small-conductance mechanosensitive channel
MSWSQVLNWLSRAYADPGLPGICVRILTVLVLAWLASYLFGQMVPRLIFALGPRKWRESFSPKRLVTLRDLIASVVRVFSYLVALIVILQMFINATVILAVVSLFSLALSMSARPLVSDVFTGVTLLFEDQFAVGEKVELSGVMGTEGVMGTVERVGLRTTYIRADSGELFIVPNGDVRVVRNFSRGEFSLASITVSVRADRVREALTLLQAVGRQAHSEIADIIEEPMVMSETGILAAETTLTLKVKTRLGQGAPVRAELLARAEKRLVEGEMRVVAG